MKKTRKGTEGKERRKEEKKRKERRKRKGKEGKEKKERKKKKEAWPQTRKAYLSAATPISELFCSFGSSIIFHFKMEFINWVVAK